MHKLTLKKLVRSSSIYGPRRSSADVYIDDTIIGHARIYSRDEIIFYPNTDGDAYLANFISISDLFELIKQAVDADKAVDADIAKIPETNEIFNEIFINAKDNTMSYISTDADESIRKKLIFYGYEFTIGITSVDCETESFDDTRNNLWAEVDQSGQTEDGDGSSFGFFFLKKGFTGYFHGQTFNGNGIITTKYTIDQLSNEVKCFHIEDKESGPTIVEHNSNPKIIPLDDFLI